MGANLPYVTGYGNISKALEGIKKASTPDKLTGDFVKTVLKIPGGSGDQILSYLKKIGFAGPDGTVTSLYKEFRNPSTSGVAVARAMRHGYSALFTLNEYLHKASDEEVIGLIVQHTGKAHDEQAVGLMLNSLNQLKKHADFDSNAEIPDIKKLADEINLPVYSEGNSSNRGGSNDFGLNLGYTINLNLPATSDIAVFNAIFKSLKENLLRDDDA